MVKKNTSKKNKKSAFYSFFDVSIFDKVKKNIFKKENILVFFIVLYIIGSIIYRDFFDIQISQIPLRLEQLLFFVAMAGAAIGGYLDLKTTEIPDYVPIAMTLVGVIIHGFIAYLLGISYFLWPLLVAFMFLVFGYALYYTGQWGEADVLLLAAVGFLIPYPLSFFSGAMVFWLFPVFYLVNTFIVGGSYSILYAFIVSVRTRGFFATYFNDLKKNIRSFFKISVYVITGITLLSVSVYKWFGLPINYVYNQILFFIPFMVVVYFFYRFAHIVDHFAFRVQVNSKDLAEGDVLAEDVKLKNETYFSNLFIGLGKIEIAKIIAEHPKKKIWIKEGIRYAPTFFLTLLFMWLFGNVLFLIIGF
ncbi:MAG: prepilin peptidase [Candidatus Aenigmarchaeota archaeon]|nr:prepilin peptidase [Candidatus Aenigmarchaeota archaeon]